MINDLAQDVAGLRDQLVATRRDFHRHPELSFQERRTGEIVANRLDELGWKVKRGVAETGVMGLLEGSGPGKTVLLRVDIDALPIQEPKDRPYSSQVDGVMHACGHDGHTAVGMAVAELLSRYKDSIKGRIKLVFQPAEEIMSGAIKMIEEGVMKDPDVDRVLSFHLWSGLPVGQVVSQAGPIFSSADEIRITARGKGGHGGMPHLSVDPIIIASHIVTSLQTILSRDIAPTQTAVLGFGTVHGGTAFNVVSDQVELSGTIRTLDDSVREFVLKRTEEIASAVAKGLRGEAEFKHVRGAPAVVNDESVAKLVAEVAAPIVGEENVVNMTPPQVGDDATFFLREAPGCYFLVGCANSQRGITASHHNAQFDIDEDSLSVATRILTEATLRYVS
ncbi:MAG: amidohydrolase [Dehalococcoidia bacterium]|nr:amidohydrolase [Dehalococcoidia bacterium]